MSTETALVTGASSGIGLELARLFAADKCNLVLVARRRERLESLADQLRQQHGIKVTVAAQDLTQPAAPETLAQHLRDEGVTIDVLVNNAGFGAVGAFAQLPLDRQLEMVQLNVVTLTALTWRFLPEMVERGRGAILNVASTAAFQPSGNMSVYFATKAYVLSLSEGLSEELRGTGVTVTCLCPGPTATEFGVRSGVDQTLLFRLGTVSARYVALRGYRAFRRGEVVTIPGLISWFVTFSLRFTPRWLVRRISTWLVHSGDHGSAG